jgi:pimeloyl-ACP methyl ester carboxylesterase
MPTLSDIAVRVLDEFGVATADVVGFSFGGAVAQQIAFGHPSRVNRLVLLATSCGVGSVPGRAHDVTRILLRPNDGTRWHNRIHWVFSGRLQQSQPGPVSATSAA